MKVLYINYLYSPNIGGGAEITLKSIVEGIQRRGHEVVVLATGGGKGLSVDEVDGVKVYRAGIENDYWPFAEKEKGSLAKMSWHWKDRCNKEMAAFVRQVVELERPDVASCHNLTGFSVAAWAALERESVPVIQVLHDLYLLCFRSIMFKNDESCVSQCLSCKIFRLRHGRRSRAVDAVVGVSRYVLDRLIGYDYFEGADKLVINNARSIAPVAIRDAAPTGLVIGFIGTIVKSKGVEWLISSFKRLNDSSATLRIAGRGEGSYIAQLKRLAGDANVDFVGYAKPSEFFGGIDICVVPSLWPDTFPGVAFEALAYNVPVIATNKGGLPEIVRHGISGLICDANEPDSLLQSMNDLVENPEKLARMKRDARQSVDSLVDIERMIGEHESLYRKLVLGRSGLQSSNVNSSGGIA